MSVAWGGAASRVGGVAAEVPAADAQKALDPVHALSHHGGLAGLRVALHGDDRRAQRVVARDEVAAWACADERCARGRGGWRDAVADMGGASGVVQHGSLLLGVVRSVVCWIGRVLFGAPDFVR